MRFTFKGRVSRGKGKVGREKRENEVMNGRRREWKGRGGNVEFYRILSSNFATDRNNQSTRSVIDVLIAELF